MGGARSRDRRGGPARGWGANVYAPEVTDAVPRGLLTALAVFVGALLALTASPDLGRAVVGGTTVAPGRFPAVVRLADVCTATLIGPNRLMTAGHCISYVEPGVTRVRIGGGGPYRVSRVARHPRFRYQLPEIPAEPIRDVALVELERAVPDVAPMPLSRARVRAGTRATLVGFGTSDPDRLDRFGTLRSAELVVRGVGTCRRLLERAMSGQGGQFQGAAMLCTQDPANGRPPASGCNGDSGGPLLRTTGGVTRIIGIDSWGIACGALDGDPEVFVRVALERRWALSPAPAWSSTPIADPWEAPASPAATRTVRPR